VGLASGCCRGVAEVGDVLRIIADAQPDGHGEQGGEGRRSAHHRTPAPGLDQHAEGYAGDDPADDAEQQGQARGQGKLARCKPVRCQLQHRDKGYGHRSADQQTSCVGPPEIGRDSKQGRADGRHRCSCRQQPARPPAIGEDPGRDLHCHIGVEIEGREVAQFGRANGKLAHQPVGHHRRRDPLVEADQVEQGTQSPYAPGDGGRWIPVVVRVQHASPVCSPSALAGRAGWRPAGQGAGKLEDTVGLKGLLVLPSSILRAWSQRFQRQ
jgi:hypothetical protein